LEAFGYTISHDLRNPLNVISSYSQVITEIYGDRLDEQCQEYVREITSRTFGMSKLIDALLNFSILTHYEIKRDSVDLSGMAGVIAGELRMTEPDRDVRFIIADGLTANGDKQLLRLVLENLLGNAWKYTARKEDVCIEFGVTIIEGKKYFFVRDNGPGFDMAHADKLFAPFQRLQSTKEFTGHGIGLATVQRIIQRHGGRIWAEGEAGKGATFYFYL
jgi:light-regulated signal transduction histidine kinase (bacteriophytochrome)